MSDLKILPSVSAKDPNLFAMNWELLVEVLAMVVVLSFIVERALALWFESEAFIRWQEKRSSQTPPKGSLKPLFAFLVAAIGCILWEFDAISIILANENSTVLGAIVTGAVIAGGSKASIKLFRDVLDFKSNAYRRAKEDKPKVQE